VYDLPVILKTVLCVFSSMSLTLQTCGLMVPQGIRKSTRTNVFEWGKALISTQNQQICGEHDQSLGIEGSILWAERTKHTF